MNRLSLDSARDLTHSTPAQGHPEPACGEPVEPVERMSLSNGQAGSYSSHQSVLEVASEDMVRLRESRPVRVLCATSFPEPCFRLVPWVGRDRWARRAERTARRSVPTVPLIREAHELPTVIPAAFPTAAVDPGSPAG